MLGLAILEQPLQGQSPADAEVVLRRALAHHKSERDETARRRAMAGALGRDEESGQYWQALARSLEEQGRVAETLDVLREVRAAQSGRRTRGNDGMRPLRVLRCVPNDALTGSPLRALCG